MPRNLTIHIDDDLSEALDRMIADVEMDLPRELAAEAALRDWLSWAGYLPNDDIEEDTPTEGEA